MKLKIGKTSYEVRSTKELAHPLMRGRISYANQNILVATHANGKPRDSLTQHKTLWHEIVHGILYDIGSKKYRDEVFVSQIAERIVEVNKQLQEYHG